MHPTVPLAVWGAVVGLAQIWPLPGLAVLALPLFLASLQLAPARLGNLLKRARWLLLSILVIFSLATPGVLLAPEMGRFGPTGEGVELGVTHSLRLLVVLATLAILLQRLPMEELVAGLHSLLFPFRAFGLNPTRVALRVMMVLRLVEQGPPRDRWRDWLDPKQTDSPSVFRIRVAAFALRDIVVLVCIGLAAAFLAWVLS